MAKAKISYAVACKIHGNRKAKADDRILELKVSIPLNKRQRLHGGCPLCNKDKE